MMLILLMMMIMSIDNDNDSGTLQDTKLERLKKKKCFFACRVNSSVHTFAINVQLNKKVMIYNKNDFDMIYKKNDFDQRLAETWERFERN